MKSATVPRLIGELLGTALLVFFGVGAMVASDQGFVGAVALLATVTVAYWIFGGHFNPWITLATAIRGSLSWVAAGVIIVAQLLGGILGAVLIWGVFRVQGVDRPLFVTRVLPEQTATTQGVAAAILAEALAVFLLACVVFAVGETERLGVAMGLAYAAGTLTIVAITAASMNLARTLGTDLVQVIAGTEADWAGFGKIWIYIVSGVLGAALAGLLYPMWRPAQDSTPSAESVESQG